MNKRLLRVLDVSSFAGASAAAPFSAATLLMERLLLHLLTQLSREDFLLENISAPLFPERGSFPKMATPAEPPSPCFGGGVSRHQEGNSPQESPTGAGEEREEGKRGC